ncbi:serine/threonine protein kinase [Streptomyces malaysiensis]|uniref:non-specific serine/threonine protein kinase n=1 Tax=Streptomyces malaysiensis TaxID=92644 RepID=A0A7X5X5S8_STRMQ|nr:serine/threonine-protein kinase [Streptomyces malaysiensis]NIY67078.1 serine/threonine protein kinase [Streptomyces malaysiensis]
MEDLGAEDPRWIGDYRLVRRLGAGGMGRVFLAHSSRGRTVAVKLVQTELAQQAEFRRRFKQEVRAAQRVGGAWTAPVLDADTEAATPWVATGYIAGPSLHAIVSESGRLPERTVRILAHGLTQALRDIHGAELVHRDLKPSNVLITIDGPRVIDFGIARALETVTDGILTRSGAVVGSPGFMSPEQVRGERVTPASDVFCLGSVLAYAATGRQPFGTADSGVHAVMYRIAQEEPDLEGLPEGLHELVTDCLKKAPDDRPSLDALLERTAGADDDGEPWLPGGLVAQLGRHAMQLLEVETPAGPGVPARPAVPPAAGAAGPAVPPAAGPAVPPPPAAPPSATSYPLAPAEPPTPPPPTTPPRPTGAPQAGVPLPPAPSTPPAAGAAGAAGPAGGGGHAAGPYADAGQTAGPATPSATPQPAGDQSTPAPTTAPQAAAGQGASGQAGGPSSGGQQAAAPSADPRQTAGPQAGAGQGASGQAGGPQAAGPAAAPAHGTPGGQAAASPAVPGRPQAGAPAAAADRPGPGNPYAAAPGTPGGPQAGGPSPGPGQGAAGQAAIPPAGAARADAVGESAAAPNSPGPAGPYAAGAYGYPAQATPPQATGADREPRTPPNAFGPPDVTSFGAGPAAGSPSAGFGGPTGPSGPGTPGGPGIPAGPGAPGGPGAPAGPGGAPVPKGRRKTLIVVSAAVATLLIAGVTALAVINGNNGNNDKGDRAKTDYDKMTHTPPNGPSTANSKAPGGGSAGPDPSATKLETTGDVPTEYLGAWEGEIKESGSSTGKIRRVVLSQGPVGAFVAETLTSDSDSFCQDSAKLKSADSLLLIEDEEVATSIPEDSCSTVGEQTLRIGNDGTLAWSTTDGSYEATLRPSKTGGKPIPSPYVGTWLAKDAFGKPDATLKLTIEQGAIGTVVAQQVADSKKYHCEGDRVLASVEKGLVLSPSKFTGGTPKNLCGPGTSLTFTSSGHDKLRVEYDDPDDYSDETMTQTFTRLD